LKTYFGHIAKDKVQTRSGVRVRCPNCRETQIVHPSTLNGNTHTKQYGVNRPAKSKGKYGDRNEAEDEGEREEEREDEDETTFCPGQYVVAKWCDEWLDSQIIDIEKGQEGGAVVYMVALRKGRKGEVWKVTPDEIKGMPKRKSGKRRETEKRKWRISSANGDQDLELLMSHGARDGVSPISASDQEDDVSPLSASDEEEDEQGQDEQRNADEKAGGQERKDEDEEPQEEAEVEEQQQVKRAADFTLVSDDDSDSMGSEEDSMGSEEGMSPLSSGEEDECDEVQGGMQEEQQQQQEEEQQQQEEEEQQQQQQQQQEHEQPSEVDLACERKGAKRRRVEREQAKLSNFVGEGRRYYLNE
jgi:hypothetical protein